MIINWGCHVSVHQNLWIQKQKLRIHYVGHQCCLLSKKVLSSIPDWSLRVLPRARFLQVLWLPRHQKHVYDSFWFILFSCHALSVLKQKILPFPRSLQKASLPWSTTRVFVIIPPEDISVSGGHFSKTYILYVLEKQSGLWQERQTKKRSSFSIPPLLWFSIEATLNKLLNPKRLLMSTLYGSFPNRCMNRESV